MTDRKAPPEMDIEEALALYTEELGGKLTDGFPEALRFWSDEIGERKITMNELISGHAMFGVGVAYGRGELVKPPKKDTPSPTDDEWMRAQGWGIKRWVNQDEWFGHPGIKSTDEMLPAWCVPIARRLGAYWDGDSWVLTAKVGPLTEHYSTPEFYALCREHANG